MTINGSSPMIGFSTSISTFPKYVKVAKAPKKAVTTELAVLILLFCFLNLKKSPQFIVGADELRRTDDLKLFAKVPTRTEVLA